MGKQLLFDALQGKETSRPAWLPFVGCHGARLIGKDVDEYLQSGELIVEGIREAIRRYRPDGIPVLFDLQIEAEALGCQLKWAQDHPPTVVGHVLDRYSLSDLQIPDESSGRIPEVLNAIRRLKDENHDLALYGLITGPFTLALHLKGSAIFLEMYDKPGEVRGLLGFCTEVAKKMARMYIEAGCDVIASVDPMTSQISPRAFTQFVSPYASELFEEIRRLGAFSSFFVCGHAQKNVEVMCRCKPDNISVDENIPLDFVKEVSRRYGISFGGNLQLTVVLLMGDKRDVRRHTLETLEMGGHSGYILAPGCDLPVELPPENLETVAEIVHTPYQPTGARKRLGLHRTKESDVEVAEFGQRPQVVVEIITLESEASAPSRYMIELVRNVTEHFGELVVWREYKLREADVSEHMLELMVKNVPMICIDNEIKFSGIIPPREKLIQAVQKRLALLSTTND